MRVFVSYHSRDRDTVRRLVEGLRLLRPHWSPFFDEHSLTTGYWMPQLAEGVARAEAFLFLFGEKLGPWQTIEYYGAFDRRVKEPSLPITPILTGNAAAPGLPFFEHLQWRKEADPAAPDALARIVDALERTGSSQANELWRLVDPYRGLKALREEDAALLFGREQLVADMVEAVAQPSGKVLVAVGNSGVGKSSLIFAGVFAALSRQGWPRRTDRPWPSLLSDSRSWLRLSFPPREDPLKQLARAFAAQWLKPTEASYPARVDEWAARLAQPGSSIEELIAAADAAVSERGIAPPSRYVLYVDQGEELYARAEAKSAARFSQLLADAARDDRCRVLMSLRADFYGRLQDDAILFAASGKIDIPRLDDAGVRAVIQGPAEAFNATFEPGLVDKLARATMASPSGLPLLSYQMEEIWSAMVERGDGVLRLPVRDDFEIARALIDRADGYLKAHPEKEDATRRLFCTRLVHVPVQGAPTRQVALQKDLAVEEREVVDVLSGGDYRLVTTGENDRGEATAEIGHETLLTSWERLRTWIGDRRGFYAWLTQLGSVRRDYEAKPERKALLQGRQLEIARANLDQYPSDVPDADAAFVKDSHIAERRDQDRDKLRGRVLVAGLVAVAAVFLALGLFGIDRARQALASQSRIVAQKAADVLSSPTYDLTLRQLEKRWETAALLALEAWRDEGSSWWSPLTRWMAPERPEASAALRLAFGRDATPVAWSGGQYGPVRRIALLPDGRSLATIGADTVWIWDVETGRKVREFTTSGNGVGDVSRDGTRLVMSDGAVFDLETGTQVGAVEVTEAGEAPMLVLSPGATTILMRRENSAVLTDIETGAERPLKTPSISLVTRVAAFSQDGERLATGVRDRAAQNQISIGIWDTATAAHRRTIAANAGNLNWIDFAAGGDQLGVADGTGAITFWNVSTGARIGALDSKALPRITSARVSSDGERVLTTHADGSFAVWDVRTRKLRKHVASKPAVLASTFSADGLEVVTLTSGDEAQVREADSGNLLHTVPLNPGNTKIFARAPLGGDRFLAASSDGTVRVLSVRDGSEIISLEGPVGENVARVVSQAGKVILTAGTDNALRLWNAETGAETRRIDGHEASGGVQLTADGRSILVVNRNTATLIDSATGAELRSYQGESGSLGALLSSDGGRVLTLSVSLTPPQNPRALLWNTSNGELVARLPDNLAYVDPVFSHDGKLIAGTDDNDIIRLWSAETGREVLQLEVSTSLTTTLTFSRDNRFILGAEDESILLWDAQSGKLLKRIVTGEDRYWDWVGFSPDGKAAVAIAGGGLSVWDLEHGAEFLRYEGKAALAYALFSEDGARLLAGTFDNNWVLLKLDENPFMTRDEWELARRARAKATRCLTEQERRTYNLDPEPPDWCRRFEKATATGR